MKNKKFSRKIVIRFGVGQIKLVFTGTKWNVNEGVNKLFTIEPGNLKDLWKMEEDGKLKIREIKKIRF